MDLRALQKEIHALPKFEEEVDHFQQNWLKPIRPTTNNRFSSLQELPPETRKELNQKMASLQDMLQQVRYAKHLQEKLYSYVHMLIELKLTTFNGNHKKAKLITHHFLNDDVFRLKKTIQEVLETEQLFSTVNRQYSEITEFIQQHLSLEDSLHFQELPHKRHLQVMHKTAKRQKQIIHDIGKSFLQLAKQKKQKKSVVQW